LSLDEVKRLGEALGLAERVGLRPAPKYAKKRSTASKAERRPKSADVLRPANAYAVAAIRFLLLSGWREGEALSLKRADVDTERQHAILGDTKTSRSIRPLGACSASGATARKGLSVRFFRSNGGSTAHRDCASLVQRAACRGAPSVFQDARTVRTKNSKTFTTFLFPVGDDVRNIVVDWVTYLRSENCEATKTRSFQRPWSLKNSERRFEAVGLKRALVERGTDPGDFPRGISSRRLPYFNP
jgi:hypothetical protein